MKKLITLSMMVFAMSAWAQVGINTASPQATLHIASPATATATNNGGMILDNPGEDKSTIFKPGETFSPVQLFINSLDLQNQNILVQDANTGVVNHMQRHAFTYMPARPYTLPAPFGSQQINERDYTILVQQDFTLPNNVELTGKIINLTYSYSNGTAFTIDGPIQWNGQVIPSIEVSRAATSYTLQFNGTRWIVINGFQVNSGGKIRAMSSGTVTMTDGTILVDGPVLLPEAAKFEGREYRFIYNSGSNASVGTTGSDQIFIGGSAISTATYGLNSIENNNGITVQSDGSRWIIVSRF